MYVQEEMAPTKAITNFELILQLKLNQHPKHVFVNSQARIRTYMNYIYAEPQSSWANSAPGCLCLESNDALESTGYSRTHMQAALWVTVREN